MRHLNAKKRFEILEAQCKELDIDLDTLKFMWQFIKNEKDCPYRLFSEYAFAELKKEFEERKNSHN